jgi:hypothetical protein
MPMLGLQRLLELVKKGHGIAIALPVFGKASTMTKTYENMSETIRDTKPAFRKVANQPKKERRHRYERRKINELLRLGGQLNEEFA